jgi:hypothetical protein
MTGTSPVMTIRELNFAPMGLVPTGSMATPNFAVAIEKA